MGIHGDMQTGNENPPSVRKPSCGFENNGSGGELSDAKFQDGYRGGQCSDNVRCFNQISQSAIYKQDEKSVSLTCCGGSYGGGSECIVLHDR